MSYLGDLTLRLAAGAMRLPEELRRRHAAFLADAQNADGGFAGRQGPSNLYYTGFALRGLALLGALSDEVASAAGRFLREHLGGIPSVAHTNAPPRAGGVWDPHIPPSAGRSSIDFLSLVFSAVLLETASGVDVFAAAGRDRKDAVTGTLERFRRRDGGYAKTDRSPHSSTYHTFLAASCLQLVGAPIDEASRMIELIRSRRRDDGGFVELDPMRQGGTNPTAAAVGVLRLLDAMDDATRRHAVAFLARMQNAEGGLRANARIPVADVLSTFTGLVTLADLGAWPFGGAFSCPTDGGAADLARMRQYVETLDQAEGGFRGGAWDDAADVEYTFYGLGTVALLAELDS